METILGLGGVAVLYWAYSKYKGTGTVSQTANNTSLPVYVSATNWSAIAADTNRTSSNCIGYREPDPTPDSTHPDGEWDSMCGTFSSAFPGCCNSLACTPQLLQYYPNAACIPAGTPPLDQIMSWFKGLNINPVHNQGYAITYKADIQDAYNAGLLLSRGSIVPGQYVVNQQITPLPGASDQCNATYGSGAGTWANRTGNGISGMKGTGIEGYSSLG